MPFRFLRNVRNIVLSMIYRDFDEAGDKKNPFKMKRFFQNGRTCLVFNRSNIVFLHLPV